MQENAKQLLELLAKSIELYEEDRAMAVENYEMLQKQLHHVTFQLGMEMSEEGKLEKECNAALKLVFESGKRLDAVIETVSKILITQLTNESRENIAGTLSDNGMKKITEPVNLRALLLSAANGESQ